MTEPLLTHVVCCQLPMPEVRREKLKAARVPIGVMAGEWLSDASTGNSIRIIPSKLNGSWRNPAAKLRGADDGKLLCAMYAWDGGAYPGNEFYEPYGMLCGSGDPAAACCSTITELGNPEINTAVCGARTLLCRKDGTSRLVGTRDLPLPESMPAAAGSKMSTTKLRRSPSAEGLHRLLERDGLSNIQRKQLLRRLQRQQAAAVEGLDALLQHSDAGLEMGKLLAERDALAALADPCAPADTSHFVADLVAAASVTDDNIRACSADVTKLVGQLLTTVAKISKAPLCPPPPLGGPPPTPPGPPPKLADSKDSCDGGETLARSVDPRTKMTLEIERAPLKKKLEAGTITEEEQARLEDIEATLKPLVPTLPVAPVGDSRGAMMAAISARRVD